MPHKENILKSFQDIASKIDLDNFDQRLAIGDNISLLGMLDAVENIRNKYTNPEDIFNQLEQWAKRSY